MHMGINQQIKIYGLICFIILCACNASPDYSDCTVFLKGDYGSKFVSWEKSHRGLTVATNSPTYILPGDLYCRVQFKDSNGLFCEFTFIKEIVSDVRYERVHYDFHDLNALYIEDLTRNEIGTYYYMSESADFIRGKLNEFLKGPYFDIGVYLDLYSPLLGLEYLPKKNDNKGFERMYTHFLGSHASKLTVHNKYVYITKPSAWVLKHQGLLELGDTIIYRCSNNSKYKKKVLKSWSDLMYTSDI